MKVCHDLFKFTTADENPGLGGSVGADLRVAMGFDSEIAAQEPAPTFEKVFSRERVILILTQWRTERH